MASGIQNRYKIQTLSARIHEEFGGVDQKGYPRERQCNCLRTPNNRTSTIDLFKKPGSKRAYFYGLQTCGSIYSCPICAVKISEQRQREIEELLDKTKDSHHYLITLTVPHYIEQGCKEIRDKFKDSRRKMKNWGPLKRDPDFKPYTRTLKHLRYDGSVTTVEVTYGQNGWHIHSHELVILKDPVEDLKEFREMVYQNWKKAVEYSGIEIKNPQAFWKRSVKVEELHGDHITKMTTYLTKLDNSKHWGMPAELTKGFIKKAENNNLTPFGMLHAINDAPDQKEKQRLYDQYAPLFWEYCQTFKGGQMIYFSKGLKAKHGIENKTNEEVVKAETLLKEFYGYFEKPEFAVIKALGLRGWVIDHSHLSWEDLTQKLNNEITKRKGLRRYDNQTEKQTFFRETG